MESFASDVQAVLMELDESERQADELISVNFVVWNVFLLNMKKKMFSKRIYSTIYSCPICAYVNRQNILF